MEMTHVARVLRGHAFNFLGAWPTSLTPKTLKARVLERSGLIDPIWLAHCRGAGSTDPRQASLAAFERGGAEESLTPLFDAAYYRSTYGLDVSVGDALYDYLVKGEKVGRKPSEWFDPVFFREQNPDAGKSLSLLATYQRHWFSFPKAHPHFDADWYASSYPDTRVYLWGPLAHFAGCGLSEGRSPNAHFDPNWYLQEYPDVKAAGVPPALHFSRYGAAELRSPGPSFNPAYYSQRYPGLRDPFAHFLKTDGFDGVQGGDRISLEDLLSTDVDSRHAGAKRLPLEIIIPVYRDLAETRACIESVLASELGPDCRISVRNDSSPELEVTLYLRGLAAEGLIELSENDQNLGFVRSVNASMREALARGAHSVILLNSDTRVSGDWVSRMLAHLDLHTKASSVTAMSNNATICSWPQLGSNVLPEEWTYSRIDEVARQVNARRSSQIPVGVGFCMLITSKSLEEVGLFDEEAFGRGYGEEVDFCLRASEKGYVHLLAEDVFVQHTGEVSFAGDSKPGKVAAEKIILERYPNYNQLIAAHIRTQSSLPSRLRLTFSMWRATGTTVTALFSHSLGGGTALHVGIREDALNDTRRAVLIESPATADDVYRIRCKHHFDGFDFKLKLACAQDLRALLALMGVSDVEIHHPMSHTYLRETIVMAGLPFSFHVHDYFSVCPQITFTTAKGTYCGEPDAIGCNRCIAKRPRFGARDIDNWRLAHAWLGERASKVIVPSEDTANRISKYMDANPTVVPHEADLRLAPRRAFSPGDFTADNPLNLVVIGTLVDHKGKQQVLQLLSAINDTDSPIIIHLIGACDLTQSSSRPSDLKNLKISGKYAAEDLQSLVAGTDADAFLFPSTAPETYSFTLSEALQTGLPIFATDHGAFRSRLAGLTGVELYPVAHSGKDILEVIQKSMMETREPSSV